MSSVASVAESINEKALVAFSKAKGSSAHGDTAQQKRDAAARDRKLQDCPPHVKAKWEAIKKLKGRDRSKNAQKTLFTQKILSDAKFEDAYWQSEVSDTYNCKSGTNDTWVLRSKADWQHGGGSEGHKAVQDAIDCGRYQSRSYKGKSANGQTITIEEVNISEEMNEESNAVTYKDSIAITVFIN